MRCDPERHPGDHSKCDRDRCVVEEELFDMVVEKDLNAARQRWGRSTKMVKRGPVPTGKPVATPDVLKKLPMKPPGRN